ncbi:MAG: TIGR03435 family protein, partial [Terriglobia bacterium]
PEVYAEGILKTCEFYLESPLACMSGVTGSDLKKRIVRIMTQRVGRRIGFARKVLLAAAGTLAIGGPLASGLMNAPASTAQTTGLKPKFEVASIKPDKSGGRNIGVRISPGGRIHANNVSLKILIEMAYDVKDFQLTGGPKWTDSTRYDIEAKPSDSVARNLVKLSQERQGQQLRLMLKSLLADRFKLTLSRTTRQLPIYALVVSQHGPKIHPARLNSAGPPGMRRRVGLGRGELDLNDAPLSTLADGLSRTVGRVVVDKTDLKGFYDFTLKWIPERKQAQVFQESPGGYKQPMGDSAPPGTSGPSLFTAIREQLGLKLKAEKGPVQVFVIEHVEQPSAN